MMQDAAATIGARPQALSEDPWHQRHEGACNPKRDDLFKIDQLTAGHKPKVSESIPYRRLATYRFSYDSVTSDSVT
jgi:hypothetical protein